MSPAGMNWTSKSILDCSWLPYNGPRKLYLDNLMNQAGPLLRSFGQICAVVCTVEPAASSPLTRTALDFHATSDFNLGILGQAGLATDADVTLNVTILTTVRPHCLECGVSQLETPRGLLSGARDTSGLSQRQAPFSGCGSALQHRRLYRQGHLAWPGGLQ